jgi:prevent-host-death family protein
MERIGVRELRQNASKYLAEVKEGKTVEVTERGELIALLVPPQRGQTTRDRMIAEGRLIPAANPPGHRRSYHPVQAPPGTPSTEEMLDYDRADRF